MAKLNDYEDVLQIKEELTDMFEGFIDYGVEVQISDIETIKEHTEAVCDYIVDQSIKIDDLARENMKLKKQLRNGS